MAIEYSATLFYGIKLEDSYDLDEVLEFLDQEGWDPSSAGTIEDAEPLCELEDYFWDIPKGVRIETDSYLGDVHEYYLSVSKSAKGCGPIGQLPTTEGYDDILNNWIDKLKLKTVGEPSWFLVPSVY